MIPNWSFQLPWTQINHYCGIYKLDPYIVGAMIQVESAGNTWAIRYEPKWDHFLNARDWASKIGCTEVTEEKGQATSWGLMQVMGTVAREHGFDEWFPALCEPSQGVKYGCMHLRKKADQYHNIEEAIAAYNAGKARYMKSGMLTNERYVDRVMKYFRELRDG